MNTLTQTLTQLEQTVASWNDMTTAPHRFGGVEFLMGNVEIGHFHRNGMVDIPFTRKIREALVSDSYTDVHHLLPETGWTSYYIGRTGDVNGAIQLFRLSYIHKRKRRVSLDLPQELAQLAFNDHIKQVAFGTTDDTDDED